MEALWGHLWQVKDEMFSVVFNWPDTLFIVCKILCMTITEAKTCLIIYCTKDPLSISVWLKFFKIVARNQNTPFFPFASSGPPSPPQNLVYTLKQSTLILEWAAPSDTGGRTDLTYTVACRRCVARHCEPCGSSIGFVPQQVGLTERTVTMVNLLPNTNYTFTVEALNGVSELLPNKRFYTQVNVSTNLPGEFDIYN